MAISRAIRLGASMLAAALLVHPVAAQEESGAASMPEPADIVTDSEAQAAQKGQGRTPSELWRKWLKKKGITEGINEIGENRTFFIASGKAQVRGDFGSKNWLNARQATFNQALLAAKSEMANTIGSVIKSDRASEVLQQGGDQMPPQLDKVRKEASTIDRMQKLTTEALDAQIKKYDPDWQGGDKEEREQKRVQIQERYQEKVASGARLLINGATPIFNAEGDNMDQSYTVLVGIVWSPRMAALSESLYNENIPIPKGPKGTQIVQKLKNKLQRNPDFLALSQGVRVWNKADGTKVLVSFAPVYRTRSSMVNEQKAALIGRSQIAQFVAEDIASRQMSDTQQTFRAYDDDSSKTFNTGEFKQLTRAKAKKIEIKGATRGFSWKGQHPNANVPMQTDVYIWSPQSRDMAKKLEDLAEQASGTSRTGGQSGSTDGLDGTTTGTGNAASPAKSGAGSNVGNF